MDNCMYIGTVENGFVLEVKVPNDKEEKKGGKDMVCCHSDYEWKNYYFKTAAELGAKVSELLPLIQKMKMAEKEEEDADDAYEKSFAKALEAI